MNVVEEFYNNSKECINIPNSDCGCCDTIREFYKKAEEWYNNIMKKLAPDEEPEVTYGTLRVSISQSQELLGNVIITKKGDLNPLDNITSLPVGTIINIKATPSTGYDLDYWTVNRTRRNGNPLTYTIEEGDNNRIIANFKRSDIDTNEYFWFGAAADYDDIFTNTYKHLINNTVNIPTASVQNGGDYFWIICNENWNFEYFSSNGVSTTLFNLDKTVNGNNIYKSTKSLGANTIHNNITIKFS